MIVEVRMVSSFAFKFLLVSGVIVDVIAANLTAHIS